MLLMPGEGIAAQLNQLGSVWRGAQHRQIVLTPVESHHYPGDELVLCDWFTFPAPFDCNYQRKTRQEWKKTLRGKCMRSNYLPQGVSFNMKM